MKLRTIILLLSAFCSQLYAQLPPEFHWRTINTGINSGIRKITFSDSLHGWAITQYDIARTTDGGESWQKQTLPVDSTELRRLLFTSSSTGYVIGEKGLILATKDGGNSWIKQNSGDDDHLLKGISFLNDSTGWVTGQMDDGVKRGGILLYTTNGGERWDTLSDRSDFMLYFDVNFRDKDNGIVIGSTGFDNFDPMTIYKTTDGGKTLNMINQIEGAQAFELYSAGKDTLWSQGFGFMKSFDYGATWNTHSKIESPDTSIYLQIVMQLLPINGRKGYAVYSDFHGYGSILRLLYTEDAGGTWIIVPTPEGFEPTAICKGGNYFYVSGKDGRIITNKPNTVNVEAKTGAAGSFELKQNYPNPFNPSTVINYEIPKASKVTLKVYDMLGKEAAVLIDGYKEAGRYSVQFNAKDLPSGMYIYQLRAGGYASMRKMMLVK